MTWLKLGTFHKRKMSDTKEAYCFVPFLKFLEKADYGNHFQRLPGAEGGNKN